MVLGLRAVIDLEISTVGTLGGIWLGWVLQGRRRHDVEKRDAYLETLTPLDYILNQDEEPSESVRVAFVRAIN